MHTPPPARLYTLGPAGTFSDRAAQRLRAHLGATAPSAPPRIEYTRTIPEVIARTESDPDALGVFPIENSDTGTVVFAQDSLARHRVRIEWELNLRVRFSLLATAPLADVTRVFAQPVAYDQCGTYLTEHLPLAQVQFTNSNVESGRLLLDGASSQRHAAIVPAEYGEAHRELLVAEDIQNYLHNTTRFLVVRASKDAAPPDYARLKTSIRIDPEADRPGLLYDLLSVFNRYRLNLCRLESRPAKVRAWTYVFFLDFNNNAHTAEALAELARDRQQVTVLGSYDPIE